MTDEEYAYLAKTILKMIDIDLDHYRAKQMRRRLETFIESEQNIKVVDYCRKLETNPDLTQKMRDFLTINVSEFFRDGSHFDNLRNIVLPDLLKKNARLNIWSAGCSNGSEIYSVAMLLDELTPTIRHRLIATDIDHTILDNARAGGPYSERELKSISKQQMEKYFTQTANGFCVVENIKQRVIFKKHDLLCDSYDRGFDLIMCRNVVIYFTDEAKLKLNKGFYESLKEGGVMFVGGSEIIMGAKDIGFANMLPCFYRKTPSNIIESSQASQSYNRNLGLPSSIIPPSRDMRT